MIRRLSLTIALVVAAFVAGLVLTAGTRTASVANANLAKREMPASPAPATTAIEAPAPAPSSLLGGPDFTGIAGQAVKGVANISSLQVNAREIGSPEERR